MNSALRRALATLSYLDRDFDNLPAYLTIRRSRLTNKTNK